MPNAPDSAVRLPATAHVALPGGGEMASLVRSLDWSRTSLGHVAGWPSSLRTAVSILLTSRFSMWMGWGPDLTFLYNDAYRPTLGIKHPSALGAAARDVWAEIWSDIGSRIQTVLATREGTFDESLPTSGTQRISGRNLPYVLV